MANNDTFNLKNYLTTSRDELRYQLTEYFKEYLQLSASDIRKSSALGYLIETITYMTSNLLFYTSMIHKESNLLTSILPDSIYDHSSYIGYTPNQPKYSILEAIITIETKHIPVCPAPTTGDLLKIVINKNFKAYAEDIPFINENKIEIYKDLYNTINILEITDNGKINKPYSITVDGTKIQFTLSLNQYITNEYEYTIPIDLKPFQYYNQIIPINESNFVTDIIVMIDDDEWTNYSNLFEILQDVKGFTYKLHSEGIILHFGNGIFGKQPNPSGTLKIITKETKGKNGNIIPGKLTLGDKIYYLGDTNGAAINVPYTITNYSSSFNGENEESLEDIKRNAIINLRSLNRLVSEDDYKNIGKIIDIPIKDTIAILKRSDLKCNEIILYSLFNFFKDEYIPTRTDKINILNDNNQIEYISPFSVYTFNDEEYYLPFEIIPNYNNLECNYNYYNNNITYDLKTEKLLELDNTNIRITINKFKVLSHFENRKFIFYVSYETDDSVNMTDYHMNIILSYESFYKTIPMIYDDTAEYPLFHGWVDFINIPAAYLNCKIQIIQNSNNIVISEYSTVVSMKINLKNITKSQMKKISSTNYTIYDVPFIQKKWFDSLYISEDVDLRSVCEQTILNGFIKTIDSSNILMLNTYMNNKFVNTDGELTNLLLSKPTYEVYQLVQKRSDITKADLLYNDLFLINGNLSIDNYHTDLIKITNINDKFYNKERQIAKYVGDGTNDIWEFIEPNVSQSCLIKNPLPNIRLYFNGSEWIKPSYRSPLEIEIVAYLENFSLSYSTYIQDEIYNYFKENIEGINKNLYRSQLIRFIQDIPNVVYIKLIKPEIDLLFDYDIDNIQLSEMVSYVPQLVTTTKDKIKVRVEPYR